MKQSGMTLVELALTVGLAGIIGIPTGLLLSEHLRQAVTSRDSQVATQLARYEMERLDGLNNFFHPDLNLGSRPATIPGYPSYNLAIVISCLPGGNCTNPDIDRHGIKRIQITVTKPGLTNQLARMISYRTKCVCFSANPPLSITTCGSAASNVCS